MKRLSLLSPEIALIIFIVALFIYLFILDTDGAFSSKFLRFGPSSDSKFLNIQLDSWSKVISVYFIALFSSLSLSYYQNVVSSYVSGVLLHPAYKDSIAQSKIVSQILVTADPIVTAVMAAINFFITLTMEFQFIFFQLLGTLAVSIPVNLYTISKKKFTSE
jgi:hypothetical protein